MRVLVFGDRYWTNREYLYDVLDKAHARDGFTLVIEGEARGADTMAREWAESRGVPVAPFPANWRKYGRAAGPIRNTQMLEEGKPDRAIGFHPNLMESKGSRNMATQCVKALIPCVVLNGRESYE